MSEKKTIKLVARAEGETDCRTEIKVRQFTFRTDEPTNEGGTDEAPSPAASMSSHTELLSASASTSGAFA